MAQVGTEVQFLAAYVDNTGAEYSPTPTPTITILRLTNDFGTDVLAVSEPMALTGIGGTFGYLLSAELNDEVGTLVGIPFTSDASIDPLLRTWSIYEDVTESAAVDLSGIEADLAVIKAKALLITEDNTTFTQPNDPITGDLTIVRGDDYTLASARPVPTWSNADWTPLSLTTALSITFKARSRATGAVFTKTAEALSNTSVRVQLTNAETAVWKVGREAYDYDLEAALANGAIVTLAQGNIHVWSDVR